MDRSEQISIVTSLCNDLKYRMIQDIISGNIPEEWEGVELRQLLGSRFLERVRMSRSQKTKYNNTVIVNNL